MNNNKNIEIIEEQLRIMNADLEGARSMIDRIQHDRERIANAEEVADHE